MFLPFIFMILQDVMTHRLNSHWFERDSTVSLECKETIRWLAMENGSCAILAAKESVYNFGFVVRDDTCVVCRAGGTLEEADVVEIPISGPLYIDSKDYLINQLFNKYI